MKFVFFNLMPWPDLPDDFRENNRSVWVDIDSKLYDPERGHHVYHEYMDQLEYADSLGFDGIGVNEHHQNGYGIMPSPNIIAAGLARRTSDAALCVIGNSIALTGLNSPNYGEGVYIGTAQGNWCLYNGCAPDASDRNLVAFNSISSTTAEPMEAKAGTSDGTMWKNTLDGAAITSSDTDSLVQVMGSGWVVAGNVGAHSPEDAIQVWNTDADYGLNNIVYGNAISGTLAGYGIRMPYLEVGNVVGCDNTANQAALGMSNKTCQN